MELAQFIASNEYFTKSRIPSLYSDFQKSKTLNPEGFHANIDAWYNLLHAIINQSKVKDSLVSIPTYNPDLGQFLSLPSQGPPKCLGTILNELVTAKKLIPLSLYNEETSSYINVVNNTGGIQRLLSPKNWLKFVRGEFNSQSNGALKQERYIDWDLLNQLSDKCLKVINTQTNGSDKLFNESLLLKLLTSQIGTFSTLDLSILITFWSRDARVCNVKKIDDKTYIKFDSNNITDNDISIIDLKSNIEDLTSRNQKLEQEIDNLNISIKKMVQKNTTERAKHLLRLRRTLSNALDYSTASLTQLQSILHQIEQSNFNLSIYDQLVSSNKILKNLNSKLDMDDISKIKEEIDEEMAKSGEITDLMTEANNDINVDDEFEALLEEENKKNKLQKETIDKNETQLLNQGEEKRKEDEHENLLKKLDALTLDNNGKEATEDKGTESATKEHKEDSLNQIAA